jgi:Domain of unknown function (DUF4148)
MKTLNATLLAALIAIPTVSFADGGATDHVTQNIHSVANASAVRTVSYNNDQTGGLIVVNDAAPKTRAQVLAELAEVKRLGLNLSGDRNVFVSAEQNEQIAAAGVRALNADRVASNASVAALIASPSVAQ